MPACYAFSVIIDGAEESLDAANGFYGQPGCIFTKNCLIERDYYIAETVDLSGSPG